MSEPRPEEAVGVKRLTALMEAHGAHAVEAMVEEILYRLAVRGHSTSPANVAYVVGVVPEHEWAASVERGRANGWKVGQ